MKRLDGRWLAHLLAFQVLFLLVRSQTVSDGGASQHLVRIRQEHRPGTLHWALAVVLSLVLVAGLVRTYRVLKQARHMTIVRRAPEGMRTVECGACRTAQYVTLHGRIFICCSCHCANRIPTSMSRPEEQELVLDDGPLKKFEFKKGGQNFWQELSQEEIEDGTAVMPESNSGNNECGTVVDAETNIQAGQLPASNEVQPETNLAQAQDEPKPNLIGKVEGDLESSSNIGEDGIPQCVVCLDKPGCMVLLPCAHGGVCEGCVTRIAQNRAFGGAHCPHCRSNIKTIVRINEIDGELAKGIEFRIPMARPVP